MSQKGDGEETRAAVTYGFGNMATGWLQPCCWNAEGGQKQPIYYRDRMGRGSVGVSAIGQEPWGFDPNPTPPATTSTAWAANGGSRRGRHAPEQQRQPVHHR